MQWDGHVSFINLLSSSCQLVNAFTAYIPSLYVLSFVYCIEASLRSMAGVRPNVAETSLVASEIPHSLGRQRIRVCLPHMAYSKAGDDGRQQQDESTKTDLSGNEVDISRAEVEAAPAQPIEVSLEGRVPSR